MGPVVNVVETGWKTASRTGDAALRLYAAAPSRPVGGVLVLQEAFGVNSYIQDLARRFAAEGYLALAPDLYCRQAQRTFPYSDVKAAVQALQRLDYDDVVSDIASAAEIARAMLPADAARLATVGFCWGGTASFLAATRLADLTAAVIYYGSEICRDEPDALHTKSGLINCPLLIHVGTADTLLPAEAVARIETSLSAAGAEYLLFTYQGAGHAFACDARPATFQKNAADAAWERTLTFLQSRLSRPAS